MGATCCHPSSLLSSYGLVLDWGQGGNVVNLLGVCYGGFDCIPWFPLSLFNGFARVAHSLAIWLQPWHLKHCRVLESCILGIALCTCWCLGTSPSLWSSGYPTWTEELWAKVFWPRPVQSLWELGWTGVFLSVLPLPWPLYLGLFGALAGKYLVMPCLVWPSTRQFGYPVPLSHLTLQWLLMTMLLPFLLHPHFLPSAFLAVTISWEYVVSGLPWRYLNESQICLCTPWNSQSLRWHATSWSIILLGHLSQIWLKVPSSLVAKVGTLSLLLEWLYRSFASRHQMMLLFQKWPLTFEEFLQHWQ